MQRFVIAAVALAIASLSAGFPIVASALDRPVTQAEIDRIAAVRQMIAEKGYNWEAGVTSVSNLTDEEMLRLCGLRVPAGFEERRTRAKQEGRMIEALAGTAFPQKFDWRTQGGVTPIKNQGNCGSCWAFSATAAFESQILLRSGLEEDLSEQAVVSCNTSGDNCDGGWMTTAYDMFINHGAVRESCMPYHEVDTDPCVENSCDVAARLDSYYDVDNTVDAVKTALLDGPVASAMAVCGGFQTYTGGCYQDVCTDINHGVLIVGWDDTMCGGQGAWIVKNSWAPSWGVNGYIYMKYGTCQIGYGAQALHYTPGQTVHFFHDSHVIDDSAGDNDGMIEVGEPIVLPITILNIGATTATNVSATLRCLTAGVTVTDSTATYGDIPKGTTRQSDAPHFAFTVSGAGPSCGPIQLSLVVSSTQGTSQINLTLQAGTISTVFADDFETDKGWSTAAAGDNATTGIWTRVDPNGTWWGDQPVQPEDDHSNPGTYCYVTGQGAVGGAQGAMDVDGGKTTLTSPAIDLSAKSSALLTYWRWYASETGSAPNNDNFVVDVSNNNGSTWTNLETLPYSDRAWRKKEFYLENYLPLTNQMKVRFIAQDNPPGSIVEAALDDFSVKACAATAPDVIPPSVTVSSPNGGETWAYGSQQEITWSATDNVGVTSIDIFYSTDGGATFPNVIATGEPNDGSYLWTVPNLDSKTVRIKVKATDAASNQGSDTSDADFTLWGTLSGVPTDLAGAPAEVTLSIKDGNPITSVTRIVYGVPAPMHLSIAIYDVSGRMVAKAVDTRVEAGYRSIEWAALERSNFRFGPGIYFVRLDAETGARSAKVVVAR